MDNLSEDVGIKLEQEYVKSTYDNIAEDFSSTRYKKWPKVNEFLTDLPQNSLLLDVGCGNGKYLDNPTTFNIGCDLSINLLKICKSKGFEVVLCDMSRLPFRREVFNSVICVAALHHVVSERRRQRCIEELTSLLEPRDGKLLIQVWSFEQEIDPDNPYLNRNTGQQVDEKQSFKINDTIELPIHKNRRPFKNQDVLVPFHSKSSRPSSASGGQSTTTGGTLLRYYHVFKEGELESMLEKIPRMRMMHSYYDRGNWCAILSRED